MRRFLHILIMSFVLMFTLQCCDSYDSEIDDLKERITALEEWADGINDQISALQTAMRGLRSNTCISSVVEMPDNTGYYITFQDSTRMILKSNLTPFIGFNGNWWIGSSDTGVRAEGQDGKDGYTPVISVAKYSNGEYYWTLDGEWMKDASGNMIPATGMAPRLRIGPQSGEWEISNDGGSTWVSTGTKAAGIPGSTVFADNGVSIESGKVTFTLADGTTFSIPRSLEFSIGNDGSHSIITISQDGKTIPLDLPESFKESDFGSIMARVTSPAGVVSDIKTRSDEAHWSVSVSKPTFNDGVCNNDASVRLAFISESQDTDELALLEVIITDPKGHRSVSGRLVQSASWEGQKADSFAGGTGTEEDPYLIESPGQLLRIFNFEDASYKIIRDLDLNGHPWPSGDFSGSLDGGGHTISNLYVKNHSGGLFAECTGHVSNLTISHVVISSTNSYSVGAFSGSAGNFTNCHVILDEGSSITGHQDVGGICGRVSISSSFVNCSVIATSEDATISGTNSVGGIVGFNDNDDNSITGCVVKCDIKCMFDGAGGIIGATKGWTIKNCHFEGTVTSGRTSAGGIIGSGVAPSLLISDKAVAEIHAMTFAGGLIGKDFIGSDIQACYSSGTVDSDDDNCGGLAAGTHATSAELSYSTMTSSGIFYPLGKYLKGKDCAVTTASEALSNEACSNCEVVTTSITSFLKEANSEYADLWNFNNTWNWQSINCPRLAWEE